MILKRHGRTIKKGWSYQGKLKLNSLLFIAMDALNASIGHPTTISQQYRWSATMYCHRHKQRINIPPEAAPQQYRWCINHQKSNNFSRRRISSPIYAAAQHYHHRLTCKDLPKRCLMGYDATRRQIEAYGGRRWPSFDLRGGGGSIVCLLFFVVERR